MTLQVVNKSATVEMFTGGDDPDVPEHVKRLPTPARTNWVNSHNYHMSQHMDPRAAVRYADSSTYVTAADMADMVEDENDGGADEASEGEKAVLTSKKRNALSNSSFAYVDDKGNGHLPINDAAHVRNALARFNQTQMPSSARAGAMAKIRAAAKRFGVSVSKEADFNNDTELELPITPEKSLIETIKGFVKSLASFDSTSTSTRVTAMPSPFLVYKGANEGDPWRVIMIDSNIFKDQHKEIIRESAHKEYVDWVEKSGIYPDMHLWHGGPASKWGEVDFVDFVDGFSVVSGLVSKGKEHIASNLEGQAKEGKLRVSHGFYGLKDKTGVYSIYRKFEVSPLPAGAEANQWTGYLDLSNTKELSMPFSDAKKAWLKDTAKLDDAAIKTMEDQFKSMGDTLKAAGVEYKEVDVAEGSDTATKPIDGVAVVVGELTGLSKALADVAAAVVDIGKSQKELAAQFTKSRDEMIADAILPKIAGVVKGAGYVASESASNVKEGEAAAKEAETSNSWFTDALTKQLGSIGAPAGGN